MTMAESVQNVNEQVINMGNEVGDIAENVKKLNDSSASMKKASASAKQSISTIMEGSRRSAEAVNEIKVATHRYAKRQRTWFRKDKRIRWIDADSRRPEELLADALAIIEDHGAERPSPRGNMK